MKRLKPIFSLLLLLAFVPLPLQAHDIHDTDTLEAFIDGVIENSMEENHVAGVVVSITTPDEVLLSKGYGYADVEQGIQVTPDKTLFRIGSVSKLFVWLPLMQLLEQGKLYVDADVNDYLTRVHVPDTFERPVTLADIMTHTAGFEDQVIGLFGKDASSMRPLADILNDEMPLRVRPPGQYASYSNHAVGIAGLMIEEISGQSWADYIEEHVLTPLGMHHTSPAQPLPEDLDRLMSKGYTFEAGKYVAKDFEYVPLAPVGAISASATDMTRFLQMFLNDGELDGARVMAKTTSQEMQSILFRPAPGLNGLLHGMYESSSNGQLIIGHGGDTLWFHTEFMLMPEAGIGFYISTNSANGPKVRAAFRKALLDRYFHGHDDHVIEFEKTDLNKLAGDYGSLRHSSDDLTKLVKLMTPISIVPAPDGELMLTGAVMGAYPLYFEEVSPLIFKRKGYEDIISFELDENGIATHLFFNQFPIVAAEKMSGSNSVGLNFLILGATVLIFGWVLIAWVVQGRSRVYCLSPEVDRFRTTAWTLAAVIFIYFFGLAMVIDDQNAVVFGISTGAKIVMSLSFVIAAITLYTVRLTPAVLQSNEIGISSKIGYLTISLIALSFCWFIYHWRLFSW